MKQAAARRVLPKADATRARILDAAARLFRERGYSAVSLRDIASAARMKAGSVYYHFDSKEAIVLEVLDKGIAAVHREVASTVEALPEGTGGADVLRAGILAHLRSLFEFTDYTSANVRIFQQVPKEVRAANAVARRRYEQLWSEILKRVQRKGALRPGVDPARIRPLLISSLNATLDWFDRRKGDLAALAQAQGDILLNGLLKKRESQR